MTGARESPRGQNAGGDAGDSTAGTPSTRSIPKAPADGKCPTCNRPPTCRKCHLLISYYAGLGAWWCGTTSCPDRPSPPPPFTRVTSPPQTPSDGAHPEMRQGGREGVAVLVTLADVQPETVRFLWPGRIPLGKLTICAGPPDAGKSYSLLDIGARVTRGAPLPDGEEAPLGDVILLTAEDGLADTVRPRLDLLGADSRRFHALTMVREGQGERMFSLENDLPLLEGAIIERRAIFAVIDPLLAYTGRADSYKESEVRALLAPLAAMCERTGCAVTGVIHLNKRGGEHSPLNRITASLAFVAQARSVLLVAVDPEDESGQRRILAPVKMNLCAHPPSLAFHIGEDGLAWDGPVNKSATDLLALPEDKAERGALADAEGFLRDLLADGPIEAREAQRQAREAGIMEPTLRRAKAALGIRSYREGGIAASGRWVWAYCPDTTSPSKMIIPTDIGDVITLDGPDREDTPSGGGDDHLSDAAAGGDAIPSEFTGHRHLLIALGLELGFPNATWPGGGIPSGRYYYQQAARFFSDADIEKAVAALEAMKAARP